MADLERKANMHKILLVMAALLVACWLVPSGAQALPGDTDSDGVADLVDPCPMSHAGWVSTPSTDRDGDGCRDSDEDADDDGDRRIDTEDHCLTGDVNWISNAISDHDSDGCRDALEDTDDDADGRTDAVDACPRGVLGWASNLSNDRDSDGCQDATEDTDDDADGSGDVLDDCVTSWNPGQADYDQDSVGDACDPMVGAPNCVVPAVARGTSRRQTASRLILNGCELGLITKKYSRSVPAGRLIRLRGYPGDVRSPDSEVGGVFSKGRRPKH
jgi:hypothetical protein